MIEPERANLFAAIQAAIIAGQWEFACALYDEHELNVCLTCWTQSCAFKGDLFCHDCTTIHHHGGQWHPTSGNLSFMSHCPGCHTIRMEALSTFAWSDTPPTQHPPR